MNKHQEIVSMETKNLKVICKELNIIFSSIRKIQKVINCSDIQDVIDLNFCNCKEEEEV